MEEKTFAVDETAYPKAQLLLAEKRTALAVLRTGIMIFALPLTVLTALIAFSGYYDIQSNIWLLVPIVIIATILFLLGIFLIYRSVRNILSFDILLEELRQSDPDIIKLIPKADTKL